jgi:hypothetical protein
VFQKTASPFADEVAVYHLPEKFKIPEVFVYTWLGDPIEHLDGFRPHLDLFGAPDEVACRAFPLTLLGSTREWFWNLPPKSIRNFDDFGKMFLTQFTAGIVRKKPVGSLMSLRQGLEESLKSFLMRFNQERLVAEDATNVFVYCALF